jgi:predicted dehydrogenase
MLEALLIGCGNIGALYDINDKEEKVLSHAKSYFLYKNKINLTITDTDNEKINLIRSKYQFKILKETINYKNYDIVSLTTPTVTHYEYLKKMMEQNVPLIFCEKPVAVSIDELLTLKNIHKTSTSKIVVNYIRRFNPQYSKLKNYILQNELNNKLVTVNIKYSRGFLNNASHALDIIQFLFQQKISFTCLKIHKRDFDVFESDPTVSGNFTFNTAQVNLIGLNEINYTIFEIEFYFTNTIVQLLNSGNEIKVLEYNSNENKFYINKELHFENLLNKYMEDVFNFGLKILENKNINDNFKDSIDLNLEMAKALKNTL